MFCMRIKLKKGYQKNLILNAKLKSSMSWRTLAKKLKINPFYLSGELKNEKRLLSKEIYNKLCELSKENYRNYIEKELDDNWGMVKGGQNSSKKEELLIKEKSPELAELIGIILGDGNIWEDRGYYYISIAGDAKKDRDYLLEYVKPLFEKLFNIEINFREHKINNEIFLYKGSKDAVFTLKQFGLLAGDKKKNDVGIPPWIFKSESYLKACVRGLIDTDGAVCPITGRNYPYIWFYSSISNLRKTFSLAMKRLGFKTSKWIFQKNKSPYIFIGSKEMIKKYIETISFKNSRHLIKLKPL